MDAIKRQQIERAKEIKSLMISLPHKIKYEPTDQQLEISDNLTKDQLISLFNQSQDPEPLLDGFYIFDAPETISDYHPWRGQDTHQLEKI
jgi:hypothetical protein